MTIFLVMLMALIVSGDDKTVKGILKDNVLLPCACSDKDSSQEFQWQMEKPKVTLVFKNNTKTSDFYGRYKGRAEIFQSNNNCSILLSNITAEDQGKYRCSFHSQGTYQKLFVNLNISARFDVCQTDGNLSGSVKVSQCAARGHFGEAWIQWNLDGQVLTNSSTTNITHTYSLDVPTGLYHFNSTLSTKLNWTSSPTCDVKANNISTIIGHACTGRPELYKLAPGRRHRYFNIPPIVMVFGLSLLVYSIGTTHRVQQLYKMQRPTNSNVTK